MHNKCKSMQTGEVNEKIKRNEREKKWKEKGRPNRNDWKNIEK